MRSKCLEMLPSRVLVTIVVGFKKALDVRRVDELGRAGMKTTYNATTGPSAIFLDKPISSRKPPHLRVFFAETLLSPPKPTHIWPSAVPAATVPVDETERQRTNGGDNETADVGGNEAIRRR
jgi:hypothetical protein